MKRSDTSVGNLQSSYAFRDKNKRGFIETKTHINTAHSSNVSYKIELYVV